MFLKISQISQENTCVGVSSEQSCKPFKFLRTPPYLLLIRQAVALYHIYPFFYKQRFFSSQPQLLINFLWIQLQILLRCSLTHKSTIIHRHFLSRVYLLFNILSMSELKSIYVVSMWSIFHYLYFHHDNSYNLMYTRSFAYFKEYVLLFLNNNVDEGCE